jgi:formate hydrogenlyase subunit 6/NADH:ubiquinone oxidoreductase subunit I
MSYFVSMSKLALKWAFRRPATTNYPFSPRVPLNGSRGWLLFTKDNCVYCNVCAKKCPTAALRVNRAAKTFAIDRLRCITCGCCVEVCPKKSLELSSGHGTTQMTKDPEIY